MSSNTYGNFGRMIGFLFYKKGIITPLIFSIIVRIKLANTCKIQHLLGLVVHALILALGRLKQEDCCKLEDSLSYMLSTRPDKDI